LRYFVQLSYKGTHFHGWQVQPNAVSVQQVLNEAFSLQLGETIYLVGAGRTDTGVHSKEMWAHFDTELEVPSDLVYKLNRYLPKDIAINRITRVVEEAHSRFAATAREYEYHIVRRKNPFSQ
jgi:tRNA pseudouridine38-40 synthase